MSAPAAEAQKGLEPENPSSDRHPIGFYFIFWGEFAERCSYYGMRAILPLYMTTVLAFPDDRATALYSSFKAACYLLPLLGGFLADRYFGKYWTIVGFSVPYVLGHFVLGVESEPALLLALLLLAGGSGVIKPNISTLMGMTYDQRRPGKAALRSAAFLWFYFSINVGAMISLFALPQLRDALSEQYGPAFAYRVAFQFPAWLMVAALVAFAAGKRYYAVEVIDRTKRLTEDERAQRWKVLTSLFGIFALIVFFWVAYEQNDNLWTFFARDHVDRTLNLGFYQKEFSPDGFQFINSLLILILVPLFNVMWRRLDPQGTKFRPAFKMLLGFLFTAGASGVMATAGYLAEDGSMVSAWWMVLGFFVLTIGEILVYGTGLELAYTAAPANMKSFVTACFLVTNALGNLINSQLSPLYGKTIAPGPFFTMTAGIVLIAASAFFFVGRRFSRTNTPPVEGLIATGDPGLSHEA
jgi:dipeptide/tripeptide permease